MVNVDAKRTLNKNVLKSTIIGEVIIISISNKDIRVTDNTSAQSLLPQTNINVKLDCGNNDEDYSINKSCSSNNTKKSQNEKTDSDDVQQ